MGARATNAGTTRQGDAVEQRSHACSWLRATRHLTTVLALISPGKRSEMSTETPVSAPTKVCPHCGAQAQTLDRKCPHCGKKYKRRTVLKVLVGLCVLGLVFTVGCVALIGSAAEDIGEELDRQQQERAITRAQFRALRLGMTERQVIAEVGKRPESRQAFESEGILDNEPARSSCIYYNQAEGEWLDVFQLCFDGGRLTSKNAY